MNYIAHTIYETTHDVDLAIALFCGLILERRLAGLYSDSVPEYHLRAH